MAKLGSKDCIRSEYKRSDLGPIVRGKYARRMAAESNVVVIDTAVSKAFPNEESVNAALCGLLELAKSSSIRPETRMSTSLEALEAEVRKLTPADRSRLLERLIASFDPDPKVEQAWELEADRREAELASGTVAEVPGHEAIARLRAKLD